jgi:hypothetical protein
VKEDTFGRILATKSPYFRRREKKRLIIHFLETIGSCIRHLLTEMIRSFPPLTDSQITGSPRRDFYLTQFFAADHS